MPGEGEDRAVASATVGLGETVESQGRAVTWFAVGQKDRAQRRVIGAGAKLCGGLGGSVGGNADQSVGEALARGRGVAAAGKMHRAGSGGERRVDVVVDAWIDGVVAAAEGGELGEEGVALGGRQVLFAQAEPAAAALKGGGGDLGQREARLRAVGDDEERRRRERAAAHGFFVPSSTSALTVTRTVPSPGAATGAGIAAPAAAVIAKRGTGPPGVSALPTVRLR